MRRFVCLLLALFLICSAAPLQTFAADNTVMIPVEAKKLYSEAFEMLELVNAERTARGLNALTMDPELLELSMQRAFETSVYWSHIRPIGSRYPSLNSRLNRENISVKGGDIMFAPKRDTQDIMRSLMNSDVHRENILLPDAKSIGIGVILLDRNLYWVQNFSRSAPVGTASQPEDVTAKMNVAVLKDPEYYNPHFFVENTTLEAGEETWISAVWRDSNMPFENITVYSSNPNVASVSGSTVTAHAAGTAILRMYYGDYQTAAQEITITVTGGEPAAPYHPEGFKDVKPDTWYADAVNWAVAENITSGTSETTFSPNDPCTRAQAVTFLWRTADAPELDSDSRMDYYDRYYDVSTRDYYYDAVIWASNNGITKGTSDRHFSPDRFCTRAQIVTFLWRAAGSPKASGANSFADVKANSYYYDAVLWAAKNNITAGVSDTAFAPGQTCTRAQIVTFLYRYMSGSQT